MSVVAKTTMSFGSIILAFAGMAILYVLATSSCSRLENEKGAKERELAKLDDSLRRESEKWEKMLTPERIEAEIARHGLKMAVPRPDQWIRIDARGVPYPNQLALARLRRRAGTSATANYVAPSVRSRPRRRVR